MIIRTCNIKIQYHLLTKDIYKSVYCGKERSNKRLTVNEMVAVSIPIRGMGLFNFPVFIFLKQNISTLCFFCQPFYAETEIKIYTLL